MTANKAVTETAAVRLASAQPELPVERVADVADPGSLSSPETAAATRVRRLVAGLPATDRQLLYLQHWQDVPVAEIANRMKLPVGTVKIRLHRARSRLRRSLDEVER